MCALVNGIVCAFADARIPRLKASAHVSLADWLPLLYFSRRRRRKSDIGGHGAYPAGAAPTARSRARPRAHFIGPACMHCSALALGSLGFVVHNAFMVQGPEFAKNVNRPRGGLRIRIPGPANLFFTLKWVSSHGGPILMPGWAGLF
jgi:hypothetical protein